MAGGLFDPLGTESAGGALRAAPRLGVPALAAAVGLVALAVLMAVAWLRDGGDRGRPVAVVPITHVVAPPPPAPPPPAPVQQTPVAPPPAASPNLPPVRADQEVEIQNGVRIVRPRRGAPAEGQAAARPGQTIPVPPAH